MRNFPYISLWLNPAEAVDKYEEGNFTFLFGVALAGAIWALLAGMTYARIVVESEGLRLGDFYSELQFFFSSPVKFRPLLLGEILALTLHFSWYGAIWGAGLFFGGESDESKFKAFLLLMFGPGSLFYATDIACSLFHVGNDLYIWPIGIAVDGWLSSNFLIAFQKHSMLRAMVIFWAVTFVFMFVVLPVVFLPFS